MFTAFLFRHIGSWKVDTLSLFYFFVPEFFFFAHIFIIENGIQNQKNIGKYIRSKEKLCKKEENRREERNANVTRSCRVLEGEKIRN